MRFLNSVKNLGDRSGVLITLGPCAASSLLKSPSKIPFPEARGGKKGKWKSYQLQTRYSKLLVGSLEEGHRPARPSLEACREEADRVHLTSRRTQSSKPRGPNSRPLLSLFLPPVMSFPASSPVP